MLADIEFVKSVVVKAGKRALEQWGEVECEYKADATMVTAVDLETERYLESELGRVSPGFAFLGEEYGWRGPENAPVWACDPIDGTTNFVFGLPHWGVSVGLIEEGVPLLGVIYLPVLDELFWAARGQGAFCNGVRLSAQDRDTLHPEDTLCLTSNSIKTLNTEAVAGRIRCLGSIAAELVCTARGNLCGTVGMSEGIVDMAAGFCIGFEAGCVVRHLDGPALDVAELLRDRRTTRHFVFAPPRFATCLQNLLRRR
jgi:fructose-1,6-bisphosphatase/inositol monophosphatase family enzyme